MRVGVVSDVHGNVEALKAVLADLKQEGGIDILVMPGDFVAFGPKPAEALQIVQQLSNVRLLRGNTDRYLIEKKYPSSLKPGASWQEKLLYSFAWTAQRVGEEGLRFLKELPATQMIEQNGHQLLAVHGSPRSDEEGLTQETTAQELGAILTDDQVTALVCGHTHLPIDRIIGGIRVINAGSVGLPFDGDPRACYVIISHLFNDDIPTRVEFRRVEYDIERAVEQLYAVNHPAAEIGAYNLRTARPAGADLIYTQEMRQKEVRDS